MAQTEFNNCPECKVDKMKPTGGASISNYPNTGKETGFQRDYKCDNCGYPHGGKAIVLGINEQVTYVTHLLQQMIRRTGTTTIAGVAES